jgi:TDG/mug DNA glycosylase family protein
MDGSQDDDTDSGVEYPLLYSGRPVARPSHSLAAVGFTRAELDSYRDATLPDLIGPGVRLLFVGINPGLWTAATQTHFGRPGNRFYPALLSAGISERPIMQATGMSDADRRFLLDPGIGITNIVHRATARADELTRAELRAGGRALERVIGKYGPKVVAILGITAYRSAFQRPKATAGPQPDPIAGAQLWVVPNPSGLNAHDTPASLAAAYRAPAHAAGLFG